MLHPVCSPQTYDAITLFPMNGYPPPPRHKHTPSQNAKLWVLVCAATALLIYFILGMVCGFTLKRC